MRKYKMKNDVRKLTDGAMMAAIMGAVLLIDRQTAGLLQSTVYFLFPLPMVFFGAKYGWKNSWMVFAAIVILAGILETPATLLIVAMESMIGMVYGCGIYNKTDTKKLVIRTMIASTLVEVLTSLVFAEFFGYDIMSEADELVGVFSQSFENMNVTVPAAMDMRQVILTALIVSVALTGVLNALVLHLFSRLLFKRLHLQVPPSTPIVSYLPPKWSGYVAIALAACFYYAASAQISSDVLKMSMEGIGICGLLYLAFYGSIAMVIFLNMRTHMGKVLPALLAFFLLMTASIAVALLGFLYITTDMHQRMMQGGFKNE